MERILTGIVAVYTRTDREKEFAIICPKRQLIKGFNSRLLARNCTLVTMLSRLTIDVQLKVHYEKCFSIVFEETVITPVQIASFC